MLSPRPQPSLQLFAWLGYSHYLDLNSDAASLEIPSLSSPSKKQKQTKPNPPPSQPLPILTLTFRPPSSQFDSILFICFLNYFLSASPTKMET